MTLRTADRVRDTTTTTGTGSLTISGTGPVTYRSFSSIPSIATNDTFLAMTVHRTADEWEVGLYTYTNSTTLARTTILSSSNGGAAVSFSAGTKDVILTQTADRAVQNTDITVPKISGGDAASSSLIIQSTTGSGSSDTIIFKTGSQVEAARFDTAQRFIRGGTASLTVNGVDAATQQYGTTNATATMVLGGFNASNPAFNFYLSRGATVGSATVPNQGDFVDINLIGAQQTGTFATQNRAAFIRMFIDGGVTSGAGGDMPGGIIFATTPNASGTPVEAMRVDSGQVITCGNSGQYTGTRLQVQGESAGDDGACVGVFRWENNNAGALFRTHKSRGGTRGTNTIVQNNDTLSEFFCQGADGSGDSNAGRVQWQVDGTPGVGDMPTRYVLSLSPDGSNTTAECFRIGNGGATYFPKIGTTATAANAFIDNATSPANSLLRSTSSLRYKTKVTDIPQARMDALEKLRPIEYTSLGKADNPNHRFVGLAAEDVAAIDPALVHWGYDEADYDDVFGCDDKGNITTHSRMPKQGATLKPDGVMYDRVLLLQLTALRQKVSNLEALLKK